MPEVRLIEAGRHIVAGYKVPGRKEAQAFTFRPDRVNRIPADLLAALRANVDSRGDSPIDGYFDEGILKDVSPKRANAIVGGEAGFEAVPGVRAVSPPDPMSPEGNPEKAREVEDRMKASDRSPDEHSINLGDSPIAPPPVPKPSPKRTTKLGK